MPNDPLKSDKSHSSDYPEGYFDLFGSLKDETFVVPEDRPYSPDYPEGFFNLFGSLATIRWKFLKSYHGH